jgi:N-acetylgalactosamine kinase
MISGDIPMGAGLSSSSALVVATAEAVRIINELPVSARRLVSLCGEGEWFVGTRGGAADHAAIRLSRRGCVTRVGFFPFAIEGSARFLPHHDLIVCNSGVYAGKSAEAKDMFNAKVTAYHLGRVWFKMLRPDLAPRIQHLRDINSRTLGLSRGEFWRLLNQLPARVSRSKAQAVLAQAPAPERDVVERLFASHRAPAGGYEVRGVVLFGLSEIERAAKCLDLLKACDATELGHLMRVSHAGDRVSPSGKRVGTGGQPYCAPAEVPSDLAEVPGAYSCSLPAIDRIVDFALTLTGVEGAQLAGAGLGGCVMVLADKAHRAEVVHSMEEQGIKAHVFRPIAGAGALRI